MATVLGVKKKRNNKLEVSWPANHPKFGEIVRWLKQLSPGYVEYILRFEAKPYCDACKDTACEFVNTGGNACRAFKFGLKW